MPTPHIVLVNTSSTPIADTDVAAVAQALQTQVDRDFGQFWGIKAQITPLPQGSRIPARTWPMRIVDVPRGGLGIHLDRHGRPFAQIQAGNDWSITASHELLEMLVDPLGHRFVQEPDIDPAVTDGHLVSYLVEVGDPCEVFSYLIGGIAVSDFVTPEYYDPNAPQGATLDFLGHLTAPFEVPAGCYLSWQDPRDGRWHQKRPDGSFVTANASITPNVNPRADRDAMFGSDREQGQHDLPHILATYR